MRQLPTPDNPASLLVPAAATVLLALLGGFVSGMLGGQSAAAPAQEVLPTTRTLAGIPPARLFEVLGERGHWGTAVARDTAGGAADETQAAEEARRSARAAGATGNDVQRSFVLVGVESRGGQRSILLQHRDRAPLAAGELVRAPDANGIVRLGDGEAVAEGIAVAGIGRDHARLSTPGGETTLQLYEITP